MFNMQIKVCEKIYPKLQFKNTVMKGYLSAANAVRLSNSKITLLDTKNLKKAKEWIIVGLANFVKICLKIKQF